MGQKSLIDAVKLLHSKVSLLDTSNIDQVKLNFLPSCPSWSLITCFYLIVGRETKCSSPEIEYGS